MSRILFNLIFLLCLLLVPAAYAQQPHWYVLLEPGNERWYRGADGHDFHEVVTEYRDGFSVVERTHYFQGEVFDFQEELWLMDDSGDVWMGENCYIDMPLEVGKNWGRRWGEWDQYYDWFTIIGWDDTWAPNCVVIQEVIDSGDGVEFIINRWYSDGIGLVHWEMSCAFCSYTLEPVVVENEPTTWGDLKSMFR